MNSTLAAGLVGRATFVDLSGGQEGRLFLALGGHHEAGEFGRDPFLGDHQRGEGPVHEALVVIGERLTPLAAVGGEVDRPGVPLLVLPVAVQRLGVV
jgi:hypothetical protein